MPKFGFNVSGTRDARRKLAAIGRKAAGPIARRATRKGAAALVPYIELEIPIGESGDLARTVEDRASGFNGAEVTVGDPSAGIDYTGHVGLGTEAIDRDDFMGRGVERGAGAAMAAVKAELAKGIMGAAR